MKRISKQISRLLYVVSVAWTMAGLCLLASCGDEAMMDGAEGGDDEEGVVLSLPIALSGMENKSAPPDTRAEAAKEEEEMAISKLYVLQFDGTTDAAKLLQCVSLTAPTVNAEGNDTVSCQFKASAAKVTKQTVYMVANVDLSAYVSNTTLTKSAFLSLLVKFAPSVTVPAAGLPMWGSNEFDPMAVKENVPEFELKAMVAKVTYTYSIDTVLSNYLKGDFALTLKQVANGASYQEPTDLSVAHTPTGLTRTSEIGLGKLTVGSTTKLTGTVYLPENIAGQTTGITADIERGLDKAKTGATYLELKGKDVTGAKTVSFVLFLGDPENRNDFNVTRNCAYTITNTISGVSVMDSRVSIDELIVNLSSKADGTAATANCYIVAENGSKNYSFDATARGNGSTVAGINYASLPDLATATEARVLWQTDGLTSVVESVAFDKKNGRVVFTTGSATEGNAVIGLFASNEYEAPCLWSWHIWKVDGAPGTVIGVKTSTVTGDVVNVEMMDRNLGAYNNSQGNVGSIGLIYQWGRKDPFPGASGFNAIEPTNIYGSWNDGGTTGSWAGTYSLKTTATSATVGTEAWAVKYPTAFITGTDWMSINNDNLWGTPWTATGIIGSYNANQGTKSIYDPCPMGYRVPPHDTWCKEGSSNTASYQNNGFILSSFSSSLWFPAARSRNWSRGELDSSPGYGHYWTSSPHNSYPERGSNLYFSYGSVVPQGGGNRALGFSVRCVSE